MKEQPIQAIIEELKTQIDLKRKEYEQALKEDKIFEVLAKKFSELKELERKINTMIIS